MARSIPDLIGRHGPKVAAAVPVVLGFASTAAEYWRTHPELAGWARKRGDTITGRVAELRQLRSPAARIRARLDIVREVASEVQAHGVDHPGVDVAGWRARADTIELRLRLAEQRTGVDRRRALEELTTDADALVELASTALRSAGSSPPPQE